MLTRLMKYIRQFVPPTPMGRLAFWGILLIGIFLRTAALTWGIPDQNNQSSIYHDEGHVLSFVTMSWEDFRTEFGEYEIVRPVYLFRLIGRPLFAVGDAFGINNGDNRVYEIAALRTVTATFGMIGLLAIYVLGKQVGSWQGGLWAMAFLTFMPAHWYYSQILKGDLIVATMFTVILVCAIWLARTGDWRAYALGAVALGAGTSFKTTTAMAAPVLLFAHLLFVWKQKRWTEVINSKAVLGLLLAAVSFALLYPYPFYNYTQYKYLIENPSMQHLTPKFLVSPATYLDTLKQYHSPTRPFFEMIFGKFLLWAFLPSLVVVVIVAFREAIRKYRSELLLVLALFVLFFHSLTFSDALDERYILPFAPFAALFPALVITSFGSTQKTYQRAAGAVLGILLVAGTAAITAVMYPPFAFRPPREQAVDWVEAKALAGSVIAQATQTSRWALVFDPKTYTNISFSYGPEGKRHVARYINPDYVIVQQEPWNYDHTFRYELAGVDTENELQPFLNQFQEKHTFGKVPTLFGFRIPQTLGTPVLHVYSNPKEAPGLTSPRQVSLASSPTLVGSAPNSGSYQRFQVAIPAQSSTSEKDTYAGITVGKTFTPPPIPRRLEEPTVLGENTPPTLVNLLSSAQLKEGTTISFVIFSPRPNEFEFYLEKEGTVSFYGSGIADEGSRIYAFII